MRSIPSLVLRTKRENVTRGSWGWHDTSARLADKSNAVMYFAEATPSALFSIRTYLRG